MLKLKVNSQCTLFFFFFFGIYKLKCLHQETFQVAFLVPSSFQVFGRNSNNKLLHLLHRCFLQAHHLGENLQVGSHTILRNPNTFHSLLRNSKQQPPGIKKINKLERNELVVSSFPALCVKNHREFPGRNKNRP